MGMKEYLLRNLGNVAKAQEARLGALAKKDTVAMTDLAQALQDIITGKADAATTLAGYGITDAMTATEIEAAISGAIAGAYKPAGTIAGSALTADLLVAANEKKIYNISSDLAITSANVDLFLNLEVGDKIRKGDDVGVVAVEEGGSTVYKFNNFAGFVNLSGYSTTQEMNTAIALAIASKITLADISYEVTGSGNAVTNAQYDPSTGKTTYTKGDTFVSASELVDFTNSEIDALWT